jgi:long-subunit fatty acid transport protein
MRKIVTLNIIMALFFISQLMAGTGTSGAQFLELSAGGRASALGGAYAAFARGVESVFINPAGLAHLSQKEAAFTHYELYADMTYENVAVAVPLSSSTITLSAQAFLSGDIQETTIDMPQGTDRNISANDFSFNLSYSRNMTDKFTAGATFRLLVLNLADVRATGIAFDAGALYNVGVKNIRIGFTINNFGPDLRYKGEPLDFETRKSDNQDQATDVNATYISEYFQLPLTFRVGFAYDPLNTENHRLSLLADGVNPNDQKENLALGVEYAYKDAFFLRAGHAGLLNNGIDNGGINQKEYTFGAGAVIKVGSSANLRFDYSFESHKYLTDISSFTVGFTF